jgi:hypothetical protein
MASVVMVPRKPKTSPAPEEYADSKETHNLEGLLDMNRHTRCPIHRVDRL